MKSQMRQVLARQTFEEKIRKVGELIRLRQTIKTDTSEEAALLASLNAGKGIPIARVREKIRGWAGK